MAFSVTAKPARPYPEPISLRLRSATLRIRPPSSPSPSDSRGSSGAPSRTARRCLYLLFCPPDQALRLLGRRHVPAALEVRGHRGGRAADLGGHGVRFICLMLGLAVLPGLGLTELRVPLSVLFMDGLLTAAAASLPRFAVRSFGRRGQRRRAQGRAARADRGRRRGRRDDRQGIAGAPAARAQSHRLRGRRPLQARPPDVRPAGARPAVRNQGHRVAA